MMNADGFKLKVYNKDPSFLNQPSAVPQHLGYWQDEPVLSNNNEFWDVFPQTSKTSVLDAQIENLLSFIQPNAVSRHCITITKRNLCSQLSFLRTDGREG